MYDPARTDQPVSARDPQLKVLVVDDEPPARARLTRLLADLDKVYVVGEAGDGAAALEACQSQSADVVLLDIRMPGMDGLETARHLCELEQPPAVIFTTAFDDYAVDAFATGAAGYLLKPIRRTRLETALNSASRLTRAQVAALAAQTGDSAARRHICVRRSDGLKLIPVSDVLYFRADQKYVTVRHSGGEELIDESLRALSEELGESFIRIHRNTLVSAAFLESIQRDEDGHYQAKLRNCEESLPISRRLVAQVRRRMRESGEST